MGEVRLYMQRLNHKRNIYPRPDYEESTCRELRKASTRSRISRHFGGSVNLVEVSNCKMIQNLDKMIDLITEMLPCRIVLF